MTAAVVLIAYGAGSVRWAGPAPWLYLAVCVLVGGTGAASQVAARAARAS